MNMRMRGSIVTLVTLLFAGVLAFATLAEETEDPAKVRDLTGLSLDELYNMEAMQLNVLGGHSHPKGQFMIGYQYMFMRMGDYRDGTRSFTPQEVLTRFGYPVVHER